MHATIVNYNVCSSGFIINSNVQYSMCHVMFIDYTNSDLCTATTGKTHITGQVIYMSQLM